MQFIYEGDLKDIEEMKLVIHSGYDSDYNSIDEDTTIELKFEEETEG